MKKAIKRTLLWGTVAFVFGPVIIHLVDEVIDLAIGGWKEVGEKVLDIYAEEAAKEMERGR